MAKSSTPITHFEIYVLDRKRWTLQVRYRHDQKDEALDEARNIEKQLGIGVKVMRETYNPVTNSCEEVTVYLSPKAAQAEREAATRMPVRSVEDFDSPPPPLRKPKQQSTGLLVFELFIIIIVAITIATAASSALPKLVLMLAKYGYQVSPSTYPRLVFGAFAGTFLLVAVPLTLVFLGNVEEDKARRARARAPTATPVQRTGGTKAGAAPAAARASLTPTATLPPVPPVGPLRRAVTDMFADALDGLMGRSRGSEPPPAVEPTVASELPPPPAAVADAPPDEKDDATAVAEPAPLAPAIERHRLTAIRFMGDAVVRIKATRPQLDAYNRFGLNLVMAGAIDALAGMHQIDDDSKRRLLREIVDMLGTKAKLGDAFCDKLDEYVLEPRYLHMVQLGNDMMARFIAGDAEALARLTEGLEGWNKPTPKQAPQRIVTVLFTDMVGSTDLTQTQGDLAAQDLVRRHNSIVRNALSEYDGREIKHTGDGIMASFASTANAVDAATAIQRAVDTFNQGKPSVPVQLRIGINAGEPIEEEDDLFGTTVQLAARICAAAEADQVMCSNVVRELSAGKGRRFVFKGAQELKGFREPVMLYEVDWRSSSGGAPELDEIGSAVMPGGEDDPAQSAAEAGSPSPADPAAPTTADAAASKGAGA